MARFSWSANPIMDVPAVLRRHWRDAKGPLKWMLVGAAIALIGVLCCSKTVP
jgi:hypothetical protein